MFEKSSIIMNLLFIYFHVLVYNFVSLLAYRLVHLDMARMLLMVLMSEINGFLIWKWQIFSNTELICDKLHFYTFMRVHENEEKHSVSVEYEAWRFLNLFHTRDTSNKIRKEAPKFPRVCITFKTSKMCNIKMTTYIGIVRKSIFTQLHMNNMKWEEVMVFFKLSLQGRS